MVEIKYLWMVLTFFLSVLVFETSSQKFYPMRYGKRDDSGPGGTQTFHIGSRYGRSRGGLEITQRNDKFFLGSRYGKRANSLRQGSKTSETGSRTGRSSGQLEIAARNDRFFLGSRYGKRADESDISDNLPVSSEEEESKTTESSIKRMTCRFTGIKNLYQCFNEIESNDSN